MLQGRCEPYSAASFWNPHHYLPVQKIVVLHSIVTAWNSVTLLPFGKYQHLVSKNYKLEFRAILKHCASKHACPHAGHFQLALDTYALSHHPSVQPIHAWEMRKSLAVLAEVTTAFQKAAEQAGDMRCTREARNHSGQVLSHPYRGNSTCAEMIPRY
jgi:hypothetical protein